MAAPIHTTTALTPAHDPRATEGIGADYHGMDTWSNTRILTAFMDVQKRALDAVDHAIPAIAHAADAMIARLASTGRNRPKGRIIYTGAGTSGRLAAVDGMEIGPTFDWPDDKVVFAIAEPLELKTGTSRDGLEDRTDLAEQRVRDLAIGPDDVVIALAASGTTPYTRTFAQEAKKAGAVVIGMANNPEAPLLADATHPILLDTGAEAISGSTRMGAGTAQKAALTLLSSLVMAKLPGIHGVHDGIMANMRKPPNAKLADRAYRTVSRLTGCDEPTARAALTTTEGDIKAASLVALGATPAEAETTLTESNNHLREATKTFAERHAERKAQPSSARALR